MRSEIKGFHILPVKLPNTNSIQYLYFKKHDSKHNSSDSRSLFIYNLPILSDLQTIKKYFQTVALGSTIESFTQSYITNSTEDAWLDLSKLTSELDVSNVDPVASKLPKNCAILTFIDKSSFQLAFNSLKKISSNFTETTWPIREITSNFYLKQYQNEINNKETLTEQVSKSLIEFDKAEKDNIDSIQNNAKLVDEDGFTLVVGSHRKTKAGILGKQKIANTVENEKAQKKMKSKEKQDFYRFQLRQKKKEEMNDLLSKFRADQEKVKLMKEKKRFRPY
ncbi:uncharacterized protein KGF55_001766 [Candida pseudojiufengensis]|uniref:uncharacterized protein n=1 Tax=Candida pseudojiufengensis TaxID=497109 RepID=UPI002224C352|nr:uncharacterized protein KGF55_001766 [Candida pseudojiufengensis]KAI5964697.1 hypothetical protein KGF55_001766 [Candida pseudojiufengensis]